MKKLIAILMCMCLLLVFAACTNNDATNNTKPNDQVVNNSDSTEKPTDPSVETTETEDSEIPDGFDIVDVTNHVISDSSIKVISNAKLTAEVAMSYDNEKLILIIHNEEDQDLSSVYVEVKEYDSDGEFISDKSGFAVHNMQMGATAAGVLDLEYSSVRSEFYIPDQMFILLDAQFDDLSVHPMTDKITWRLGEIEEDRQLLRVYISNPTDTVVDNIVCVALYMKDNVPIALEYAEDTYIEANSENDVVFTVPTVIDDDGNESFIDYDDVKIIYNSAYTEN